MFESCVNVPNSEFWALTQWYSGYTDTQASMQSHLTICPGLHRLWNSRTQNLNSGVSDLKPFPLYHLSNVFWFRNMHSLNCQGDGVWLNDQHWPSLHVWDPGYHNKNGKSMVIKARGAGFQTWLTPLSILHPIRNSPWAPLYILLLAITY